jgi:methionine aminopeptidase
VWPATLAVTMAYVDQLTRSKGIQPQLAKAVRDAMERADRTRAGSGSRASAVVRDLTSVAAELEKNAAGASGRDVLRLRALADTMKRRAESLR